MLSRITMILLLLNSPLATIPVAGAEQAKASDQTFLLGEFAIRGDQVEERIAIKKRSGPAFPALSTALRWKGDERIELDIPKEILKSLTLPDLSQILKINTDFDDADFD